jgi:hypothetical protein
VTTTYRVYCTQAATPHPSKRIGLHSYSLFPQGLKPVPFNNSNAIALAEADLGTATAQDSATLVQA